MKKIKLLALDIDGVLTDGRTTLGGPKPERKRLAFQDLDAINAAKRAGLIIALVTGESDASVDLVAARTGVNLVRRGAKDKLAALRSLARSLQISLAEMCYVGDGTRDAPALAKVGVAFAPANATFAAKHAAHRVLPQSGGHGVVAEVVRLLLRKQNERRRIHQIERGIRRHLRKNWTGNRASLPRLAARLGRTTLALVRAAESGHKIMLCGDAADLALDALLSARFVWPAIVLSSTPRVLSKQVRALARPQDVIVAFGSEKPSPALVGVLNEAESRGAEAVPFRNFSPSAAPDFAREWSAVCLFAHLALASND